MNFKDMKAEIQRLIDFCPIPKCRQCNQFIVIKEQISKDEQMVKDAIDKMTFTAFCGHCKDNKVILKELFGEVK